MIGTADVNSLAANKAALGILLDLFLELAEPLAAKGRKPSASKVERLQQVSREAFRRAQTILEDPKAPLCMHPDWVERDAACRELFVHKGDRTFVVARTGITVFDLPPTITLH
jgi:hypothetical protein